MRVKVILVEQDTGNETPQGDSDLDMLFGDGTADPEYPIAVAALERVGRCYVGGGAAPLFLLFPIRRG